MRRTAQESLQLLLSKLENVQKDGNGFNARCPAHDDNKNSLSMHITDDERLLIHCHAGCQVHEVCYATGLTISELFPRPETNSNGRKQKSMGRVVAEYNYLDHTNTLQYQAVRLEPKSFFQRRPDGEGGWVWGLTGGHYRKCRRGWFRIKESPIDGDKYFPAVDRILYRLPEIIANPGRPVWIAEGEKDVDLLWSEGQVATCNVGGAGKWNKSYSKALAGRDVILLEDNDEAGRKHVAAAAKTLLEHANSVHIVRFQDMPEHSDVSDWFAAGRTLEELQQRCNESPPITAETTPQEKPKPDAPPTMPEGELANGIREGEETLPLCLEVIRDAIDKTTKGWPRRCGGELFVFDEVKEKIRWLHKTSDFISYLGDTGPHPTFYRSPGCATKEEVMSSWKAHCQEYDAIEMLPHEPKLDGHFYAHKEYPEGDGSALADLLSRFSPETDLDGDLIKLMFATPLWGGRGGSRPAFVITSDAGRGSGKSTMVSMLSHLFGGHIDLSPREEIGTLKARLLSAETLPLRVAVLDNIKTLRFSWGELEALITSPIISGKRMYVGEESRPNTLMYVITLNGVSLSTDMAQRSVVIKLKRPKHAGAWEHETRRFIDENRTAIIADLLAFIRGPRVETLQGYSRWSAWEHDLVEKVPTPTYTQELILGRQLESDVELEETEMIEEYVRQKLEAAVPNGDAPYYDCKCDRIFIPSKILANWYRDVSNEKQSDVATMRLIRQRVKAGDFQHIFEKRIQNLRGFLWVGEQAPHENDELIHTDLESRTIRSGDSKLAF